MHTFTQPENHNSSVPLIIQSYDHLLKKKLDSGVYIANSQTV